jgi:hypothetical protein
VEFHLTRETIAKPKKKNTITIGHLGGKQDEQLHLDLTTKYCHRRTGGAPLPHDCLPTLPCFTDQTMTTTTTNQARQPKTRSGTTNNHRRCPPRPSAHLQPARTHPQRRHRPVLRNGSRTTPRGKLMRPRTPHPPKKDAACRSRTERTSSGWNPSRSTKGGLLSSLKRHHRRVPHITELKTLPHAVGCLTNEGSVGSA